MAAYDIHRHFKALRADTGRRKGRDPFATGFEDEIEPKKHKKKQQQQSPAAPSPVSAEQPAAAETAAQKAEHRGVIPRQQSANENKRPSSPYVRSVVDSDDDDFLTYRSKRNIERRASPAPLQLKSTTGSDTAARAARPARESRALAVGNLAYLDDSEEEEEDTTRRSARRPSPAPGRRSPGPESPTLTGDRSLTPSGARERIGSSIPRHTVASAFAGTKYLQDSDSDEEAVDSQRSGSQDSTAEAAEQSNQTDSLSPLYSPREIKRVDKPKSGGSGVSWRAFSAGRTEQRNAELTLLRSKLKERGKSITFVSHVVTDDGQRIPLGQGCADGKGFRGRGRERSPPRTQKDIEPSKDEIIEQLSEQPQFTSPFSGQPIKRRSNSNPDNNTAPNEAFDNERRPSTSPSTHPLTNSIDNLGRLIVAPQTIPESQTVDHSLSGTIQARSPILTAASRTSSTSRIRQSSNSLPRRQSRRSTSTVSNSPAHAFLASWNRGSGENEVVPEVKPDDEGQAIGLNGEYIIGRTLNEGGFGIIKEIRTRNDRTGSEQSFAVKIVRKQLHETELANERLQQDLEHEVSVWRHLNHPHILNLRVVFETDYATFCIMDLNIGGTLHDYVRQQRQLASKDPNTSKGLEAKLSKRYAYQLASALRYLHEDIKVCHRDVKLENCLVDMTVDRHEQRGGNLRLCDFGLADFLHSQSIDEERALFNDDEPTGINRTTPIRTMSSVIGTLEYASPKGVSVNRKLYETAGDVWAYGVVVYALCTGDLPFRSSMPSKTIDSILRADWDQNALKQASTSGEGEEVYDLVSGCLQKVIDDRWTIADCMASPWFEGYRDDDEAKIQVW